MSTRPAAIAQLVSPPAGSDDPPAEAAALAPAIAAAPTLSDCAPLEPPEAARRWSRDRQVAFLHHLAASHSVAAAARSVGMSRQSAYRLRARLRGEPFDRAWAAAFDCAFNALAHAAMERALYGVEVPHLHKGEVVHVSRRFDERLTLGLLRMRHALLPAPASPMSDASAYERNDFPGLVERVERGPEHW